MKKKIIGMLVCTLLIATFLNVSGQHEEIDYHGIYAPEPMFSQLDWYYQGELLFPHSMWGRVDIIAEPDSMFWYMNVVADAGFGQAWIIKNYPIFPEEYGVPDHQVIYFNIEELGLLEGMPLPDLLAIVSYDLEPLELPPVGEFYPYPVGGSIRDAWGHSQDVPVYLPIPSGHFADDIVVGEIKHTGVPSVQEDHNNCITGSYARSIKWLDNEYDLENLPQDATGQDVYDDLVGLGIGHGTGQNKTEEEMLEAKAAYLQGLDGRAVTKFVDLTGWMSDNVTGCTEETPENLKDWLQNELETEDVELCYDSHCVTITGIYTQGGKTYLEYRDDEVQGDDSVGDDAEKEGELVQTADGWNFDGSQVDYIVSESINDPPSAPDISGPSSGSAGQSVEYNFTSTDPNGDEILYWVDWGDETNSGWVGPYVSGETVTLSHSWAKKGGYVITAVAKDVYNAESPESTKEITMPKNKPIGVHSTFLSWLFECFPSFFPFIRILLGY